MELNQRRNIPSFLVSLTRNLRIFDHPITLAGTAGLATQQYFGDYDFMSTIDKKYSAKQVYETIKHILSYSEKINDLYFIEFKLQTKKGEKLRYYNLDEFNENEFSKYYKDVDFMKLDFVVRVDFRFIELSVLYDFEDENKAEEPEDEEMKEEEIIKSMVNDIEDLKKEGNYFKILKRINAIYNLKYSKDNLKKIERYKFINKFFNSEYGELYQTTANLKAIKLLLENYDDEETIKRALYNLKELGIEPDLDNIDNIIKKNEKEYNGKAKEILSQLKNIK